MTTRPEPGERRPTEPAGSAGNAAGANEPAPAPAPPVVGRRATLDRPPGDRYLPARSARAASDDVLGGVRGPLAVFAGGTLAFIVLGGVLAITAGLIVLAGLVGWLTGLLVRPPLRAAVVAFATVVAGLLGIWLFGRWEGGVLNPIEYLAEVQGFVVPLELLAGAGMAAAASR
jgi:hypothetical protein